MRTLAAAALLLALASTGSARDREDEWLARFTDVTSQAGIDFRHSFGDSRLSNIVEISPGGCGFVDYDGDGWLDIYLLSGRWTEKVNEPAARKEPRHAEAKHRLYRNRRDGTFEDVTAAAKVGGRSYGMGVVAADFDADGDTDLYVASYGPNELFRNDGDGTFTEVSHQAGVAGDSWSIGAAFVDYDRDGDLDLYVVNYLVFDPDYTLHYAPDGFPGPLAYQGSPDVLYRNNGDGTFTDVTRDSGLLNTENRGMGLTIGDFNADGFSDIFVSNDAMANSLFRNQGNGTFRDEGLLAGVSYGQNGEATAAMGAEFFDYDADGKLDLYVPDGTFSCLYRNMGGGVFVDVTARSGIAPIFGPYVGWGPGFADFDLDGHPDLYVTTGGLHRIEPMSQLIFANRSGLFVDVADQAGPFFSTKRMGRGVALGDYDNDGDPDVLVLNLDDHPTLLRNDIETTRHWLRVKAVGAGRNLDAVGACVRIQHGDRTQVRYVKCGGGYASHSDTRILFGLGDSSEVDLLEVTWPAGRKTVRRDLKADQTITVREETESS